MSTQHIIRCPRCGQDYDERYPAASRATTDSDIDICGPCGTDEATGRGVVQVAFWPIGPSDQAPLTEGVRLVNASAVADMIRSHPLGVEYALDQLAAALPAWAFEAIKREL